MAQCTVLSEWPVPSVCSLAETTRLITWQAVWLGRLADCSGDNIADMVSDTWACTFCWQGCAAITKSQNHTLSFLRWNERALVFFSSAGPELFLFPGRTLLMSGLFIDIFLSLFMLRPLTSPSCAVLQCHHSWNTPYPQFFPRCTIYFEVVDS